MKLLLTAITTLYVGNISVIADIIPVVKEGGKNAGVADARSIPTGNCILSDDFSTPSGLWTLGAIHPNTVNVSVANNRLNFWSPSENSGLIDAFAYALSDGWKIDMTQDWAVSSRWHITPPIPYYGDVGIALVLVLEGNVDDFYIQRGYTLGGGVFYDPNDGFIDNYESTNLWYDGVRYIQTEYNRTYSENTTYIWYVASSQRIYYSDVLYSPIDAGVSLAGMSDSPDAWLGIGGYSMGYVSSFGLGSLWGDDFCIIDGHVVTLATTWTVDDDGAADFNNIQDAIDAASDGDEIIVMPGTYTGTGAEVVDMRGKEIWLHSSGGEEVTIIDGEGARRGIVCEHGETPNTIIEGFTITNGYASSGGGMYNSFGSNPTLTDCTFENNTAAFDGGGMHNNESSTTLENCTFENNTATIYGGGMYNEGSSPTLTNCTFTNNTADSGGGMFNYSHRPTVTNCTFIDNTAEHGGGMSNEGSSPTLTNCSFENNSADYGGGMQNYDISNPTLTNCTFNSNNGTIRGGGIYSYNDCSPILTDCTFENNNAYEGSGVFNYYLGNPTLTNCIFKNNTAETTGGGMYNNYNISPTMANCTFTNNTAQWGGGMYNSDSNPTLTDCTLTYNTSYGYGGGMYNNNSNPTLAGCTLTNNTAYQGGGMYNLSSSPELTDCTFEYNGDSDYTDFGGGMFNYQSSPTLTGCIFNTNSAEVTGGMYNFECKPTLTNCTFDSNYSAFDGGGMYNSSSSTTLANCTFTNNRADGSGGGGMKNYNSSPTLTDTTVCGNTPDQIYGGWNDNGGNWVEDECECPADINGDGFVNVSDLLVVIDQWGLTDSPADVNEDGIVDVSDLLMVVGNWGECE